MILMKDFKPYRAALRDPVQLRKAEGLDWHQTQYFIKAARILDCQGVGKLHVRGQVKAKH